MYAIMVKINKLRNKKQKLPFNYLPIGFSIRIHNNYIDRKQFNGFATTHRITGGLPSEYNERMNLKLGHGYRRT